MINIVLGRRGYGKTTFIKERIATMSRVLIFDTLGEYSDNAIVTYGFDSFAETLTRLQQKEFRVSYFALDDVLPLDRTFDYFLRAAWTVGNVTIVVDEIDAVSSPTSVPDQLAKIIRYGRHRGISIIAASRRAAEVPRLLTSQADEIVLFNQSEPLDVDYLRKYVGSDIAVKVQSLKRFTFITWTPGGQTALDSEPQAEDTSG